MSIRYKGDILGKLKSAGYTTTKIRKEKLLSESVLQYLRTGKYISLDNVDRICKLLNCQPGDIMEYVPDEES